MRSRLPRHFLPVLVLTLAAAIASLIGLTGWIDHPFPGFLVYTNGRVDGQQFLSSEDAIPTLRLGDRITACDDQPMPDGKAIYRYVQSRPVGTWVRYRVERDFQESVPRHFTVDLPIRRFRLDEWLSFPLLFWLDGMLHILLGAFVLFKRPDDRAATAHWAFCLALGLFLISMGEVMMGHHASHLVLAATQSMIGPTGLGLAMLIPRPWPILGRHPGLAVGVGTLGTLTAAILVLMIRWQGGAVWDFAVMGYAAIGAMAIPAAALWARWSPTSTPDQRQAARVVLWGLLLAFMPSLLLAVGQSVSGRVIPHQELAQLALPLAPAAIAMAIVRHGLFDITVLVRRTTLYGALIGCLGIVYLAITALGVFLFGNLPQQTLSADLAGLGGAFAVSLLFQPLHARLRAAIDRMFLGERADALTVLAELTRIVPGSPEEVAQSLLGVVDQALQPRWAAIEADGRVLARLGDGPAPFSLGPAPAAPPRDLGALTAVVPEADPQALYVRFLCPWGTKAWLLLGPKVTDMPYARDERDLLRALAVQGGVALDGARLRASHADLLVQEGIARSLAEERRQVLRQVLHDQRGDLMAIALAVDLAKRQPGNDRPLARIRESVTRIERFLQEKASAGTRTAAGTPVAPAMQQVARILGAQVRQKGQSLSVVLPADTWLVDLTAVELDQVLTNLLDNACKYAPPQTTIHLGAHMEGGRIHLTVADEGPGIPPHLLDRLGSGLRADPTVPGLGFGLQNVRDLAAKAGGQVTWRNGDPGAIVEVCLPARPDDHPTA